MKLVVITTSIAAIAALGACTQTGNTERGAVAGALLGGAAGAIIGNNTGSGDAGQGAAIGAAVGAVGGGVAGSQQDRTQEAGRASGQYATGPNGEALVYDRQYERYYYVDRRSGRTYWANGEFRG
ncbi:MAG: glycine zipper domain-containing protein [Hyphomonadaceae bacterium]|nr:glycine zipper domain-containing protein [Hyphomonadaceae bacterium]